MADAGGATRTRGWIGLIFVLLTMLLGGYLANAWHLLGRPLDRQGAAQVVEVKPGESLEKIRRCLIADGLLSSKAPLLQWARLTGRDRRVRSGFYELSPAQSPREIMEVLVRGQMLQVRVTIREGLTLSQTIACLAEALEEPYESFQEAASDSIWMRSLAIPAASLEGYLYPETYQFELGASPRTVLGAMVHACLDWFVGERQRQADSLGLSLHQVLTMASIIEAETAVSDERPRISAVYHNRLRRGWLLQADPTVAYALGRIGERLWQRDLEVDSPYNTYKYKGLPPGPICSPGLESIDAALQPLEGCRDLYFVARGDRTHVFSRTLKAHNRAKHSLR
ncbi:MAG: endolytic transglycosylase MltG [Candidatus Eisenbacteria sp.]|nr:endolytic transglycosylase MltG [Candidatus Eisenbacteria bacterium]